MQVLRSALRRLQQRRVQQRRVQTELSRMQALLLSQRQGADGAYM
jgi:hypothetical protein